MSPFTGYQPLFGIPFGSTAVTIDFDGVLFADIDTEVGFVLVFDDNIFPESIKKQKSLLDRVKNGDWRCHRGKRAVGRIKLWHGGW